MSKLALPALALLTVAFLAGCSSSPPSGVLTPLDHSQPSGSTVNVFFQPRVVPLEDTANGQDIPSAAECGLDDVPPGTQLDDYKCVDPYTTFDAYVTAPDPGAGGEYKLFATGGLDLALGLQKELGILTMVAGSTDPYLFTAAVNESADLTAKFTSLEVRLGDYTYLTGAFAASNQSMMFAANAPSLVSSSWEGNVLTIELADLPANATLTGVLYKMDEAGAVTPAQSFSPLAAGLQTLAADEDLDEYAEFHIHVGASKINLAKFSVTAD